MSIWDDFFNGCMVGVEACFNAFWDASEYAIEVALVESGKSIESFVGWYKDKVTDEYKKAYESIIDERNNMVEKIKGKLMDPAEIKKAIEEIDELKKKRESKLEEKKKNQLIKLENARKSRLKKLNAGG